MVTKIGIKLYTSKIYNLFIPNLYQPGTIIGLNNLQYKISYLPWNQYHEGPAKTVHGGDGGNSVSIGNSGGGGSSGNGGGYNDKDIGGYSDGGAHRQQSTNSSRGRNGEDDDNNGRGQQRQRPRMTTTARTTTVRMTAMTARMTSEDGEDNRRGRR